MKLKPQTAIENKTVGNGIDRESNSIRKNA